jgi:hypothetical protein
MRHIPSGALFLSVALHLANAEATETPLAAEDTTSETMSEEVGSSEPASDAATADESPEDPGRRLALLAGYGTDTAFALKFGFGLRGGARLGRSHFYLGGALVHHRGTNEEGRSWALGEYSAVNRFSYGTVDFGYEFALGPVVIMPFVGFGGGWLYSRECEETPPAGWESGCHDGADPAVSFAGTLGLSIHGVYRRTFAGVDARLIESTVGDVSYDVVGMESGIAAYGVIGIRF